MRLHTKKFGFTLLRIPLNAIFNGEYADKVWQEALRTNAGEALIENL
jgi:hypothetical protein